MKILAIALGLVIAGLLVYAASAKVGEAPTEPAKGRNMHVVLIGASIGQEWNLPELPKRVGVDSVGFEALQVWEYDKSEAVEETLMRPARKFRFTPSYFKGLLQPAPQAADLVVLKECSSYFGGAAQMQRKKDLIREWVEQVRAKNIPVMITTVVPITRARAARDGEAKQNAIREFNDWVRAYASEQRIPLLDLERPLRTDDSARYLRDDLTSGDGSHLNRAAYDILDRVMLDALCQVPGALCASNQARAHTN